MVGKTESAETQYSQSCKAAASESPLAVSASQGRLKMKLTITGGGGKVVPADLCWK